MVTVPVASSTLPALVRATSWTNEGSSRRIAPAGVEPPKVKVSANAACSEGGGELQRDAVPIGRREVRDRDGRARTNPGWRDPAPDHEVTVGALGDERIEQDLVGAGQTPGVRRRTLPAGRVRADPGGGRRGAHALPPRVGAALGVRDHELVVDDALVAEVGLGCGQPRRSLGGVVDAGIEIGREPAGRPGGSVPRRRSKPYSYVAPIMVSGGPLSGAPSSEPSQAQMFRGDVQLASSGSVHRLSTLGWNREQGR